MTQTLSAVTQLVLLHAAVFKDIQEKVWNVLVRLLAHEHFYILNRADKSFLHLRVISYFNQIYYYTLPRNYCTSSAN